MVSGAFMSVGLGSGYGWPCFQASFLQYRVPEKKSNQASGKLSIVSYCCCLKLSECHQLFGHEAPRWEVAQGLKGKVFVLISADFGSVVMGKFYCSECRGEAELPLNISGEGPHNLLRTWRFCFPGKQIKLPETHRAVLENNETTLSHFV